MRASPKIMVSVLLAILLVAFSLVLAHKQSQAKAALNGILPEGEWVAPTEPGVFTVDDNQTDILSKQVFSNFTILNEAKSLNEQTTVSLADQLASQVVDNAPVNKTYIEADLKIISDPTKDDIKKYGNEMFRLRIKYQKAFIEGFTSPSTPIVDISEKGTIRIYTLMGEMYEKFAKELATLPVPAGELAKLHLEVLNNYSGSGYGLLLLGQLDTDPVAAMNGINLYNKNSDVEENILSKIGDYFKNSGIIFTTSEPGYGWNNI